MFISNLLSPKIKPSDRCGDSRRKRAVFLKVQWCRLLTVLRRMVLHKANVTSRALHFSMNENGEFSNGQLIQLGTSREWESHRLCFFEKVADFSVRELVIRITKNEKRFVAGTSACLEFIDWHAISSLTPCSWSRRLCFECEALYRLNSDDRLPSLVLEAVQE